MTASDSTTLPTKDVRFCPETGDYEVAVNGSIIGYAATELCGTQLANEYVYAVLSAGGQSAADMTQDDADALLALHLGDVSAPLVHPADYDPAVLPRTHPIWELVPDAAWLATQLPFAA